MRGLITFVFFLLTSASYGQYLTRLDNSLMIKVQDSIQLEPNSINEKGFTLLNSELKPVDTTKYRVDYSKAKLYFDTKNIIEDSLKVTYFKYPSFLTQKYFSLSDSLIVPQKKGFNDYINYLSLTLKIHYNYLKG